MFFIIMEKGYEKSSLHFVQKPWRFVQLLLNIFCAKTVNDCIWKKMCRPTEIPNRITTIQVRRSVPKQSFLISFFLLFWCPASNELTLSIKDVMKNLQYILCRNRKDLCSCFWIYFCAETVKENVQLIFFMLRQMCGCFCKHNVFKRTSGCF